MSVDYIRQKFGPVPEGFMLEVIEIGLHFINGPVYLITLTGSYNGQQFSAGDVLIKKNFSYVSAIRDNLKHQHRRKMEEIKWSNQSEHMTILETWGMVPTR